MGPVRYSVLGTQEGRDPHESQQLTIAFGGRLEEREVQFATGQEGDPEGVTHKTRGNPKAALGGFGVRVGIPGSGLSVGLRPLGPHRGGLDLEDTGAVRPQLRHLEAGLVVGDLLMHTPGGLGPQRRGHHAVKGGTLPQLGRCGLAVVDVGADGRLDLLVGSQNGGVTFHRNLR